MHCAPQLLPHSSRVQGIAGGSRWDGPVVYHSEHKHVTCAGLSPTRVIVAVLCVFCTYWWRSGTHLRAVHTRRRRNRVGLRDGGGWSRGQHDGRERMPIGFDCRVLHVPVWAWVHGCGRLTRVL